MGSTVVGAVGSLKLGGPIDFGLFATFAEAGPAVLAGLAGAGATGGGLGGLGIGLGTKKWIPRKLFGESSALKKQIKRLKESRKDNYCEEISTANRTLHADITTSSSGMEITSGNIATTPNSATSVPTTCTTALSDRNETPPNNTETTSGNIEPTATVLTTPANRVEVAEFDTTHSETNHFYYAQLALNNIRNVFSNFRFRWN